MCPKYFHLIFFFCLWRLVPNIRVLKILERSFAFHFVPFSGSFHKCILGSAFLTHTSLQLVTEMSISSWQCSAINATRPLRFKACCWPGGSPEYHCPSLHTANWKIHFSFSPQTQWCPWGGEWAMSESAGVLHSVKACSCPFPCGKQADLEAHPNVPKASPAKGSTHS